MSIVLSYLGEIGAWSYFTLVQCPFESKFVESKQIFEIIVFAQIKNNFIGHAAFKDWHYHTPWPRPCGYLYFTATHRTDLCHSPTTVVKKMFSNLATILMALPHNFSMTFGLPLASLRPPPVLVSHPLQGLQPPPPPLPLASLRPPLVLVSRPLQGLQPPPPPLPLASLRPPPVLVSRPLQGLQPLHPPYLQLLYGLLLSWCLVLYKVCSLFSPLTFSFSTASSCPGVSSSTRSAASSPPLPLASLRPPPVLVSRPLQGLQPPPPPLPAPRCRPHPPNLKYNKLYLIDPALSDSGSRCRQKCSLFSQKRINALMYRTLYLCK